jgi:hypothetical protein
MSTSQDAAASQNGIDRLEESKLRSRAAEKARLETAERIRLEQIEAARIQKERDIAARQAELAAIREREAAIPKSGQIQQGFRQEQGIYAGFSHNHRPVYVMNNVANFVPAYTESEIQQLQTLFGQEVQKQSELDKLLGTDTASTLRPQYKNPVEDRRTGPNNTSIDYAGTLAAREQGFNVGSGIVTGLEPTFQKEEDKRFAEHNKFIGLTENITTERAAPVIQKEIVQPKPPQPQNPRPHVLTGQPVSEYANPTFAQKGTAARAGTRNKVELEETINAITGKPVSSAAPKAENLSATLFNVEPKKPRKLTQEQVNALTPAEYSQYRQEYDNYNQYVKYANEKALAQNRANILVSRANFEANRKAIADYVTSAKKQGIKFVTIQTPKGFETIPIEKATSRNNIIQIAAVPVVPGGYTVAGTISEPVLFPEGNQFVGPVKPEQQDYVRNVANLFGAEALVIPEAFPKYQYEKGRVTSEKVPIVTKTTSQGPIITGIENLKSPLERGAEFVEGIGTGLLRTSLVLTNAAPEAFMEIAKTGDVFAGEKVLQKHEEELKRIGIGPSVVPSIESGKPTGRSAYYNAGELLGEIGPVLIGIKGQIKNPFSRSPVKPKLEKTVPATEAEVAKTPLGIKAYPVGKLRDQGFGERPVLERGMTPKEEQTIKKAFNIPEPLVQEQGLVRGAKDYGNLREQIEKVKKPEFIKGVTPVEPEPFYTPKVEVRRAPEPNTFRVDESAMFGRDTKNPLEGEKISLGAGPLVKVEASRGPLGGSITKEIITKPFVTETVPLGAGRVKEIRLNLGEGRTKLIKNGFETEQVSLGKGEGEILGRVKPSVEFDTTYSPSKNLPKRRAAEIGKYQIQSKDILGTIENPKGVNILGDIFKGMKEPSVLEGAKKPSIKQGIQKAELEKEYPQLLGKKSFERSAIDAETRRAENVFKFRKTDEVNLGLGIAKGYSVSKVPKGFKLALFDIGRGKGFFYNPETNQVSTRSFRPKPPPDEGNVGKGGQQTILEKPSETKGFTTTKISLGEGKGETVAIAGAGAGAVAPLPLVIAETQDNETSTITNGTETNGTATIPGIVNPPQEIDLTPSILEPASITETRPGTKFGAAVTTPSGLAYGLDALNARRSKNIEKIIIGPVTGTKQKQETFAGFPNPEKEPTRLAQPAAFKQPQAQREREIFGTPFPTPQTPKLKTPTPFPEPEKMKQPEPLKPKEPKEPIGNFGFARAKESKARKAKDLKPNAFVGNVSDVDIALPGFAKRSEILSGVKRSAKQYKKDVLFAYKEKGFKKLVTQRQGSVLSKKEKHILEREKPKEVKKQKKKTGGFF